MKGWKTWTGSGIVLISGGLMALAKMFPQYLWLQSVAEALMSAGAALGLVGLGHKLEKSGLKSLLLLCLISVSLAACVATTAWTPPSPACDSGDSLILAQFGDKAAAAGNGIRFANLAAIRLNSYTREQCLEAVDRIEAGVEAGITGAGFSLLVHEAAAELNTNFDAELLIIGDAVLLFADVPEPLSPCDQALILENLQSIRADVLGMAVENRLGRRIG